MYYDINKMFYKCILYNYLLILNNYFTFFTSCCEIKNNNNKFNMNPGKS